MYRLLIIDDEHIVREGLKILIPWEDFGFNICAEGVDGKDGLNKIFEFLPDLVLVDIKMPGMTGLELIKKAKEQGFEGKFIILTGYSDFEFAKSAIVLGVRAYILKPIDEDELIENIQNMVEELDAKKHLDICYNTSKLKAKKELCRRLLLYNGKKENLRHEIDQYGLDFHHDKYCVAILCPKRKYQSRETGTDYEEAGDLGMEFLRDVEKVSMEEKQVFIGKGYSCEEFEIILKQYNEKLKVIKGDNFFITFGHNVTHWEDIHFSYECANMLLGYQFLFEEKEIINISVLEAAGCSREEPPVEMLGNLIETGDLTGIREFIGKRIEFYRINLYKEAQVKVKITHDIMKVFDKIEKDYREYKRELPDAGRLPDMINNGDTLENIMSGINSYCIKMSKVISCSSAGNVVKRVIIYMEKNYSSDLKLELLAKMFNYNSAYLGKLFKNYIGESFNNELDQIRIKNAKRLLTDTDLKVYQVSEQVGYSNVDYFYSKFKKYVGISPKEYKNM